MKACVESIQALRFKLRMFGVPIDDATQIFCDNKSVVTNSTKVESMLNKKHNSISYHYVRWCVVAYVITVGWIPSKEELNYPMTKRLSAMTREYLFQQLDLLIQYDLFMCISKIEGTKRIYPLSPYPW